MNHKLKVPDRYGVTPNEILNDVDISFKAKGIFGFIQSKPEGWKFSAKSIARQSKDGVDGVQSGLQELEKAGLLHRKKKKNKAGQWDCEYILSSSRGGFTVTVNPVLENPSLENPINNSKKDIVRKTSKKDIDTSTSEADALVDLSKEIQKMEESPRRDINIIALFFERNRPDIRTKRQLSVAIRRHLRAAKALKDFQDDQILRAADHAEQHYKDVGWTLETLVKILTK